MKAILLGTGWRAHFYTRIARQCPDVLQIAAVYSRSEERKNMMEKEGFPAFSNLSDALAVSHDAVIVSSGKEGFADTLRFLHAAGERIIAETTLLSLSDAELDEIADYEGLVMEQYQYTPLFSSLLSAIDSIPDQLYLSGLHNHHSASIARRVLASGDSMPEAMQSITFQSSITKTGSRNGLETTGKPETYVRNVRMMRLGPALFIHDFSSNQYHSSLYGKRFEVRCGDCVITEEGKWGTDRLGYPVFIPFVFHRDSSIGNGSLTLSHVTLGERTVFVNPYYPKNLNDDEIAMARMLELYGNGVDVYSFREGVADAKIGKLL